jgi:fatty-acyl-CoA synthase
MNQPKLPVESGAAIWRHTLGDLLRRTAARFPTKVAIICGEVEWTYAEFNAVCNRLAHGLRGIGAGTGDRVAVLSRNSHAFAALRFAIARVGAVLVPINFMLTAHEVAYVLKHAGARLLCAGPDMLDLARDAASRETKVEEIISLPGEDVSQQVSGMRSFDALLSTTAAPAALEIDGRSLAQIIYTSGTESLPKGAMLTHEAVI